MDETGFMSTKVRKEPLMSKKIDDKFAFSRRLNYLCAENPAEKDFLR
jgi:hypothetical protein